MKILAITPCRKGSTGVINKNLRILCGHPLIWYTINAVKHSTLPMRHIISTNDLRLRDYAIKHTIAILHPSELSEDGRSSFGVVKYVVEFSIADDYLPDVVLLLRTTSPLRTHEDIENAVKLFMNKKEEGYDSVISYTQLDSPHPKRMRLFDGYSLINIYNEKEHILRQDLTPKLLLRNEAIYVTKPEFILKGTIWGDNPFPYIMPAERSVNINSELDFLLAEALLRKRRKDEKR